MTKSSGVSDPKGARGGDEKPFNYKAASSDLLDKLAKDISEDMILETGKTLCHCEVIKPK
jgi:hypothetical protein